MLITKKNHERLLEQQREELTKKHDFLKKHYDLSYEDLSNRFDSLQQEYDKLQETLKEQQSHIEYVVNSTSSVTIHVSDDLQVTTPVTRVRRESINKLIEAGYLPSNKRDDEFAIHLALMLIAEEATQQIVASFERELVDEHEDYAHLDKD